MLLNKDKFPVHIGFIMDGNGRWAQKKGLPRTFGHKEGAQAFRRILKYCYEIGIKNVTFYAFSTENWSRPKAEVDAIMTLFNDYLDEAGDFSDKKDARLIFLGDKAPFSPDMRQKMIELEKVSENNDAMNVAIAVNYGGRDDIVYAVRSVVKMIREGFVKDEDINEELITSLLYTKNMPDVDLVIRPSGEKRLSNFMIWQSAYAEFYYTDVLWPDFTPNELDKALNDFAQRNRRFGGV